jgi:hypothetical protein
MITTEFHQLTSTTGKKNHTAMELHHMVTKKVTKNKKPNKQLPVNNIHFLP